MSEVELKTIDELDYPMPTQVGLDLVTGADLKELDLAGLYPISTTFHSFHIVAPDGKKWRNQTQLTDVPEKAILVQVLPYTFSFRFGTETELANAYLGQMGVWHQASLVQGNTKMELSVNAILRDWWQDKPWVAFFNYLAMWYAVPAK